MLSQRSFRRRSAIPLIEFIQMVRGQRVQVGKSHFPRRINGRLASPELTTVKSEVKPMDFKIQQQEEEQKEEKKEEEERKNILKPIIVKERKRRRSSSFNNICEMKFVQSPFACEILTKSSKGMYSSTYVDIDLSTLDLQPLVKDNTDLRKRVKLLIGVRCCYLRLGTSLVVSGCIVEINSTDSTAQVVPDKGFCLNVEWVPLSRLFYIPENITEVRKTVSERVFAILQRESENSISQSKFDYPIKDNSEKCSEGETICKYEKNYEEEMF